MKQTSLITQIEALLFVVGEQGLTLEQLAQFTMTSEQAVEGALLKLNESYEDPMRAITLKQTANVYRLVTKAIVTPVVEALIEDPPLRNLSKAALEVLAIIAYEQPVTRAVIEDIRGVKSERALHTLAAKGLVTEVGRSDTIGRAILYGTTDDFLHQFDLNTLADLPALPEAEQPTDEATDLFMTQFERAFEEN